MELKFLLNEPEPLLYGNEKICRDVKIVGHLQTGAFGFNLGGAMGMGFVENEDGANPDFIKIGRYEIDIAGESHPVKASLSPII
ncbi:MAG: glycine cleavage T C-terminal barrel domain-containing protein [Chloroflexota bacterium]